MSNSDAPYAPGFSSGATPGVYLTSGLQGTGGRLKDRPSDFLVDEVPSVVPSGEGEHLFLLVQKTGLTTLQAARVLGQHFDVGREAIGYAGLKDAHAITRQTFTVHTPGKGPGDFPSLQHPQLQILGIDLHRAKIRRGELEGNRFSVRIRGVEPTAVMTATAGLRALAKSGIPNRFGEQRFGILDHNHLIGACIIRGDYQGACDVLLGPDARFPYINALARELYVSGDYPAARDKMPHAAAHERRVLQRLANGALHKSAILTIPEDVLGIYLNAFQSAIFNATLEARLTAQTFGIVQSGDVLMKGERGSTFAATDEVIEDAETARRLGAFEISITGPMWGHKMRRASEEPGALEEQMLALSGVTIEQLEALPKPLIRMMAGERRSLRVRLRDPECEGGVDEFGTFVRCAFELGAGSFATAALLEVMKAPPTQRRGEDRPTPNAPSDTPPDAEPYTQAVELYE